MENIESKSVNKVREDYLNEVKKLLIGPGSENITTDLENEIITETPTSRYATGILYHPKDDTGKNVDEDNDLDNALDNENDPEQQPTFIDNSFKPSSMGISFYCISHSGIVPVTIKTASYEKLKDVPLILEKEKYQLVKNYVQDTDNFLFDFDEEKCQIRLKNHGQDKQLKEKINSLIHEIQNDEVKNYIKKLKFINFSNNKSGKCFLRHPFEKKVDVNVNELGNYKQKILLKDDEYIQLDISVRNAVKDSDIKSITLVLENRTKENLFQSKISVNTNRGMEFVAAEDLRKRKLKISKNKDEIKENLMYRNKKTFAFGRGVAAIWDTTVGKPFKIETEYIPSYELIPMSFSIPKLDLKILRPQSYISDNKERQLRYLKTFIFEYDCWIKNTRKKIENLDKIFKECAEENLQKCDECSIRMKKTIKLLENDDLAFETFRIANETILLQRVQSNSEKKQYFTSHKYDEIQFSWRPFQLAFILLSFEPLLNENSDERDIVDLLWVSTGGGKTEAYLFAIASTIIYQRLSQDNKVVFGVTVIMRYTLRLLTTQQFSRAAAMICALEFIRQQREDMGADSISLGLWIGNQSTPGTKKEAKKVLDKMSAEEYVDEALKENKFQILECPWCHEKNSIVPKDNRLHSSGWGYKEIKKKNKFDMKCLNENCPFSMGLPVYVIDETIYKNKPTLLFSTVDKFAQIPLNREASNLFGSFIKDMSRPKLVIQDELHLISGPLGSIVGLYESGFDYILRDAGSRPKYIASTATIKNSDDQIKNLFNREVFQFPPDGIEQEDNFFVKEDYSKNGRKYIGVMSTGKTQVTTEVRLSAAMLQSIKTLKLSKKEEELYWTVVNYFNSMRELGKTSSLLRDDIPDQIAKISRRTGIKPRSLSQSNAVELTSRIKSGEIPNTLERLSITHDKNEDKSIDTLIATNMFSVGVDVGRLNNMMVVGQPKLTSEYIQATSRVGREQLGIIFSLYNSMRSRDRSHYETFTSYHENLYRDVEPTSVTPFSVPAMKKAIAAVIVSMVRNTIPEMKEENQAGLIVEHKNKMAKIYSFLLDRIKSVDTNDNLYYSDAKELIDSFFDKWTILAEESDELYYFQDNHGKNNTLLTSFDRKENNDSIPVMSSMRDVDKQSKFRIL